MRVERKIKVHLDLYHWGEQADKEQKSNPIREAIIERKDVTKTFNALETIHIES